MLEKKKPQQITIVHLVEIQVEGSLFYTTEERTKQSRGDSADDLKEDFGQISGFCFFLWE